MAAEGMTSMLKGLPADTYHKIACDLGGLPDSAEVRAKNMRQVRSLSSAFPDDLRREFESRWMKLAQEASTATSLQKELGEAQRQNKELTTMLQVSTPSALRKELAEAQRQNRELAAKLETASTTARMERNMITSEKRQVIQQWEIEMAIMKKHLAEERRRREDLSEQLKTLEEELASRPTDPAQPQLWEVVAGKRDGIVVREGQDLASSKSTPSQLFSGAFVQQLELVGVRLRFELVSGRGPTSGWVTTKASGKNLLVRRPCLPEASKEQASSTPDDPEALASFSSPRGGTTRTSAASPETEHFVLSPEKKRRHGDDHEGGGSSSTSSASDDESCCAASSDADGEPTEVPCSSASATGSCCCPTPPNGWSLEDSEAASDSQSIFSSSAARLAAPAVGVLYGSGPEAEIKMLRDVVRDLERQLKHAQRGR